MCKATNPSFVIEKLDEKNEFTNIIVSEELKELAKYDKQHGTLFAAELTLHRIDYQDIKDAGFESPGELLACYNQIKDITK